VTLSYKTDLALRALPPTILLEPYYEFITTLIDLGDELDEESIIRKEKLLQNYFNFLKDTDSKITKTKLNQAADEIIKKLHNLMWIDAGNEIIETDWEAIKDFYHLIKFIRKSDERKVMWAIYYLFFQNGKKISLTKLNELVTPLDISNITKHLKKIVDDAKSDGMNISLDEKSIQIEHNKTKKEDVKIIKQNLADQLEYFTRRSRRSLEQEILDLLDKGSYSNQEISSILDADKSQVSKTLKILQKNEDIIHSSFGQRGKQFYTTNCDKCPFGTNREACRKESIAFIVNTMNKEFGIQLNENYLDQEIEFNQSLLFIKNVLTEARKDKLTKMELVTLGGLVYIYNTILQQYLKKDAKKTKETYRNISQFLEMMPISMVVGHTIGQQTGASLMNTFFQETLSPYLPKNKQKEINEKMLSEYNKLKKIINSKI
jgi:predicted transcriptional regulator/ribosome biogenesis protein Tsr3